MAKQQVKVRNIEQKLLLKIMFQPLAIILSELSEVKINRKKPKMVTMEKTKLMCYLPFPGLSIRHHGVRISSCHFRIDYSL